jgi:flap endonuclease-1
MGIKGLYKVIINNTSDCVLEKDIKYYRGKTIAIDASLLLYQFIIAIRKNGYDLLDNNGNSVSHLYAIFIKTLKFIEFGIKPVFVFDGKPPKLKKRIIDNRRKIKKISKEKLKKELSEKDRIKYFKRTVELKKYQIEQCKELLNLMGMPYIESPGEADAQCAVLAKSGKVWGIYTDDMDILTFGSPRILKNFSMRNKKILELDLSRILNSLGINYYQFIDLCILLGSDYCNTLSGIGKHRLLQLIRDNKNIENIIDKINKGNIKSKIPDNFEFQQTRNYFIKPNIIHPDNINLIWKKMDKNIISNYMQQNGFCKQKINFKLRKYDFFFNRLFRIHHFHKLNY